MVVTNSETCVFSEEAFSKKRKSMVPAAAVIPTVLLCLTPVFEIVCVKAN